MEENLRQTQDQANKQHKQQKQIKKQEAQTVQTGAEMSLLLDIDRKSDSLGGLPGHTTARSLRQTTILHFQRQQGNTCVQRMIIARRIGSGTPGRDQSEPPKSKQTTIKSAHNTGVIQRGEATVHHGIEETATEGTDPRLLNEMYAGNWMRDFSQLNLPMPHSLVANLPKNVDEPIGESIGAEGAEDIITAVIRALAFLEFGPEVTNELITPANIGVYTPEQHVDNPMGTTAAHHLVRDSGSGSLRPGRPQENPLSSQHVSDDPDRDAQLAGKAFPGLQTENPELFAVSDAGLTNHIYNAIEWTKEQLGSAISAGESPQGRMFLGSALHAIEDYFAHSNFKGFI